MNWTATDIDRAAEEIVVGTLQQNGWIVHLNTKGSEPSDIIAKHPKGNKIVVQVKSSILPDLPSKLSKAEETNLLNFASKNNARESYIVTVVLRNDLSLESGPNFALVK